MNKVERNYGIDLLRIVSMYLVVVLHVLGKGGILEAARGLNYYVSWLMEVIAFCAVDCFGIISGYVGFRDEDVKYNFSKYAALWLMVATYSSGITLTARLFFGGNFKDALVGLLVITTNRYWYFTAYTGLFFLIPWINKLIRACTKKQLNQLALMIIILFSIVSIVPCYIGEDIFQLESGYSLIWLSILYIIGAWLKKCEIIDRVRKTRMGILSCLGLVITWVLKVFFNKGFLVNYISPTILLFAVSLVVFFSTLNIKGKFSKIISWFVPAAFGVYIIHLQNTILNHLIIDKFIWIASMKLWQLFFLVIVISAIIFLVCLLIEKIRLFIFDVLHISSFAMSLMQKIIDLICLLLSKIINFIFKGI